MKTIFARLVLAAFLLTSMGAQAATITVFNALIDGAQAAAGSGTGSGGVGAGTMTLDHDTLEFSWFVAWQDLDAPITVAHFHGPAMPGQNGGVQVPIDAMSNPSIGMATITSAQAADLLAGLWYVNIHTMDFPAGEIRGQVLAISQIPVPAALWLFGSALAGLLGVRSRRR